ncbi:uncharacterized protein LOC62_06G007949 [Vanrija pseudolonga]|uniref:N-acetyltransferase domain-containing protein n=1 Tax=Vanrija pseudolonga TaxID=143232 RepID=A0AAF0YCZ6_9TREE|nr:hypothetical protein LOC62_06G007949 [Vanrija pseudolonga]
MPSPTLTHLTDPTSALLAPTAAVLAESFNPAEDPISGIVYAGIPDLEGFTALRFRQRLYDAVERLQVVVAEADGAPGAVMIVNPPGTMDDEPGPTPYSAELEAQTPPEVVAARNELGDALHKFEANAFGNDTYYLSFICTAPSARRRGLAGALIRSLVAQAEAAGAFVTLTTQSDENVKYYSSFGFRVIDRMDIVSRGLPMPFIAMTNRPAA